MANNLHFEYRLNVNENATRTNLDSFIQKTFGNGRNTKLSVPIKLDFANSLENIDFESIQRGIDKKFKGKVKINTSINVDTTNIRTQVQSQLDSIQKDLNLKVGVEIDAKAVKAMSSSTGVMETLNKEVGKLKDGMKDLGKSLIIDTDETSKNQYKEVLDVSKNIGEENKKTEQSLKEQLQTQKEILQSKEEQMQQLAKEISSENERLEIAKERKAINDDLIQQEKDLQKEVKDLDKQIKAEQERQKIYESQQATLESQQNTQEQLTKDLKETNDELDKLLSDKKFEDGRLEVVKQREQASQKVIKSIQEENRALEEQIAKLEKVAEASENVALTQAMSKRYNSYANGTTIIPSSWQDEQNRAKQAALLKGNNRLYRQVQTSDIAKSIQNETSFDIKSIEDMNARIKELGDLLAYNRGLISQTNDLLGQEAEVTQENVEKAKQLVDLLKEEMSTVKLLKGAREGGVDKSKFTKALNKYEANPSDETLKSLENQAEKLSKIGAFYEYEAQGLKALTELEKKYGVQAEASLKTQEALAKAEEKRSENALNRKFKEIENNSKGGKYKSAGDFLKDEVYGFTSEQLAQEIEKYGEKLEDFLGERDFNVDYDKVEKFIANSEKKMATMEEEGTKRLQRKIEILQKVINSYEKLNTLAKAREELEGEGSRIKDPNASLIDVGTKTTTTQKVEPTVYEGEVGRLKELTEQFVLYCQKTEIAKNQTTDLKMQFSDLSKDLEELVKAKSTDEESWKQLASRMTEYGNAVGVTTDEIQDYIEKIEAKQKAEQLDKGAELEANIKTQMEALNESSKAYKRCQETLEGYTKAVENQADVTEHLAKMQKLLDSVSSVMDRANGKFSAESITKEIEELFRIVASGRGDLEQVNTLYGVMKDKLENLSKVTGSLRETASLSTSVRASVPALEAMTKAWEDAENGSVESIDKINESVKTLAESYNKIYKDDSINRIEGFTPTSVKTFGEIESLREKLEANKAYLQVQEQNLQEARNEAKVIESSNSKLEERLAKVQQIKAQQEEQLDLSRKTNTSSEEGNKLRTEELENISKNIKALQEEKNLKEEMANSLKSQIAQEESLGDVSDKSLQNMKSRYEQLKAEAKSVSNAIDDITKAIEKQEEASNKTNILSHGIIPTSSNKSSSNSGGGSSAKTNTSSSQAQQESFITDELSERIKLRQRDLTLQLQNLAYGKELTANQKLMVHEMMNQIVALGSSVSSMKELNLESQKIKQNLNETKFNVKVTTTEDKDAVKKLEQQRKATEEMYKGMFDELEKQEKELLAIENMYARLFDQAELNAKVEERNKVVLEEKAQLVQRNLNLKIKEFEQSKLASHADQEQLQTIKSMVAEMDKNVDSAQELQSVVGKINTLYKEMQSDAKSNAEAKKLEDLIATKEKNLARTHQSIANSKAYQNAIESQRVAFDQLADQLKLTGNSTEEVNKQYAQLTQQMKGMKLDMVTEQLGRQETAFQKLTSSMKEYFVMNLDIMDCFRMVQQGFSNAFEHTKVLDEAFTNISMTMDITEKKFQTMVDTAYKVGNANGQLATEVLNMMKVYANAGTTVEEINSQMQATVAFQNVTGLDATNVTNSIQTILQQYKLLEDGSMNAAEATEYLGDVMVGVSYNLAKEESDAMREVISGIETAGGMMKTSGASFEWFSSVIGTLAETMNASGSETANAINIFCRTLWKHR